MRIQPVKGSVLDGLGDVLLADAFLVGEVGDSAGHLEYSIVCAGAEPELRDRHLQ